MFYLSDVLQLRHSTDTDLCSCGETQTMSHIVESCRLTKLNGDLSQLHSADDGWPIMSFNCIPKKKKKNMWRTVTGFTGHFQVYFLGPDGAQNFSDVLTLKIGEK